MIATENAQATNTQVDASRLRKLQLAGIFWGWLLFRELRGAEKSRLWSVLGGALVMFSGATMLAVASSAQSGGIAASRGIVAALAAGALWGTMYIPYRKAYLSGMNPLSF